MIIRLVRHGHAGDKRNWVGDDALRPLDEQGEKQAAAIARLLGGEPPGRLFSSPTRRCCQTLEPLGFVWGRPVVDDTRLGTEASADDVLGLVRAARQGDVLCTHGEVMAAVLERLRLAGTEGLDSTGDLLAKGTFWELTVGRRGTIRQVRHVDPVNPVNPVNPVERTG